jgi:hypothetical protein
MPIIIFLYYIIPGKSFGTGIVYFHLIEYLSVFIASIFVLKKKELKENKLKISYTFLKLFTIIQIAAIFNSSNPIYTLYNSFYVYLSLSSAIVYYKIFSFSDKSKIYFDKMMKNIVLLLFGYVIIIFIYSFFDFKSISYYDDSIISTGKINFYSNYIFAYSCIIVMYLILRKEKSDLMKYVLYVIVLLSTIFIFFMIAKRAYLIISILGIGIIGIAAIRSHTMKFIGVIILIFTFGILFSKKIDINFYQKRNEAIQQSYFESNRFYEYFYYFNYFYKNQKLWNKLFGEEYFNSYEADYFSIKSLKLYDRNRILHSDYSIIIYGCGTIGLMIYLAYLFSIIIKYKKIEKQKISKSTKLIGITFTAIFYSLLLNGFIDGYNDFINRFAPFSYLGTFLGMFEYENQNSRNPK